MTTVDQMRYDEGEHRDLVRNDCGDGNFHVVREQLGQHMRYSIHLWGRFEKLFQQAVFDKASVKNFSLALEVAQSPQPPPFQHMFSITISFAVRVCVCV